jgi:glycine cleavage system regulatory protein
VSELLGANTDVLERNAQQLSTDSRRVQDIRTLAQRAVAELQASWNGSDLLHLTQEWEQQASPLLVGASASLDTCAAQLRAQSAAQRVASGADGGSGPARPTPVTPPSAPPTQGSPAGNATWWKSLSTLQQQQVITKHPDWIGNRDGVSFTARDLANRALLTIDRGFLLAGSMRLQAALAKNWSASAITTHSHDAATLRQVQDKLASIKAIEATLADPSPRQLLLLDLSQVRAQAAIANGNVQTADNVAVFVPGMTSNVTDTMQDYDRTMKQMRHRSEQESARAHPAQAETTATVTWIGYQTPELGWDLLNPDKSVASDATAKKGAAHLVPFLRGIGDSRDHDPHLTLLGHSYGSTTAGLALRQETGVDDAVFFGSPGLDTSRFQDLRLAPGHASYIAAADDPVVGLGDFGALGLAPSQLDGLEQASALESTVVDPLTGEIRQFAEVTGHSSYLADESTSQYNMSVVVAGLPDRQVFDSGNFPRQGMETYR